MLQVCLNGSRSREQSPQLPVSAAELAEAARAAIAAGAQDIHLHPKNPDGTDTLDPAIVADAIEQVRAAAPGIPIGVTTGAWAMPDPRRRVSLVNAWTVLPDHASVNWHEDGADLVAQALLDKGIGIEAGIYSGSEAANHFRTSPLVGHVLRILAEVVDTNPHTAATTATALLREIGSHPPAPILLHGEDGGAWTVLRLAANLGLDTRIGLEDVLHWPNGSPAISNTVLVQAARTMLDSRR